MSSVNTETTVTFTEEEKKILKDAIELCKSIASDCNDGDMFIDASNVFYCVYESYKDGEIPTVVHIWE